MAESNFTDKTEGGMTEKGVRNRIRLWLQRTKYTSFLEEIQKNVIGNDDAIDTLCLSIWMYLERIANGMMNDGNVLLLGPSGVGKTELYRQISKYFRRELNFLPVVHKDVSQISRVGYIGQEPVEIVAEVLENYQSGGISLVFADEVDKVMGIDTTGSTNTCAAIQSQLLCIFEGAIIKSEKDKDGNSHSICTRKTLFIGMGSCMPIREKKELNRKKHTMGFTSTTEDTNASDEDINVVDLMDFGAQPEFLGRFQTIINLHSLSETELRKVIALLVKSEAESIGIPIEISPSTIDKLIEDSHSPMGVRMYKSRIHDRVIGVMKQIKKGGYYKENIEKIYLSEDGDKIVSNYLPFRTEYRKDQLFSAQ